MAPRIRDVTASATKTQPFPASEARWSRFPEWKTASEQGFSKAQDETRTRDPFLTMEVLYQLSYLGGTMRRLDLRAWQELAAPEAAGPWEPPPRACQTMWLELS